ncbi:MAG TPA: ATP-binding protein [Steroidobacteraceae bacterium]|jgi:signal transduction histidine kinase|nr:ATP-binding protein [Steroidobacteraceae bacterium]
MARHFLGLYLLIVLTLAAVSWSQDKLLQAYGMEDTGDERSQALTLYSVESELNRLPQDQWRHFLLGMSAKSGGNIELFASSDIAGRETLDKLRRGGIAYMQAAAGESWALKQLDDEHVLALKSVEPETQRGLLEWTLTLLFYAAIALVLMIWIWPLTRDLRALEKAAARYGDKNWVFDADIKPRSQIHALAGTFRKMAARIDGLIASHKDMSNAVSHEIKTPLSRMQFEIELALEAEDVSQVKNSLKAIKADIAAINDLVTATLNYAILERADMSLNVGAHNFTALIPAIAEFVGRDARPDIRMCAEVRGDAGEVNCDMHLFETVLKNLLYNAARYAAHEVRVTFDARDGFNRLWVDDDGPGIPEEDRQRVFESFVQLDHKGGKKTGFGLGLAIVKRAIEWHGGTVSVSRSPLGGARIAAAWPTVPRPSTVR